MQKQELKNKLSEIRDKLIDIEEPVKKHIKDKTFLNFGLKEKRSTDSQKEDNSVLYERSSLLSAILHSQILCFRESPLII